MGDAAQSEGFKPLSLRRNFSWTLGGTVVYAGCQWLSLIVLTKLTSPEMVGQFSLGLAIAAPIVLLANMALRTVQATDARQQFEFVDYLALRLITTPLALFVIAGVAFGWNAPATAWIVFWIGVAKAFESFSDLIYGLMQQHERMDHIARSQVLRGVLSLLSMAVAVYVTRDVLWGVGAMAVAWAAVLVGYDVRNVMRAVEGKYSYIGEVLADGFRRSLRPDHLAPLLKEAAPLGFVAMLIALNPNVPRYLIQGYMGEHALGIFAALAYLLSIGTMVINAMGQAANPRLAKYYALGDEKAFWRLLGGLLAFGGGLGLLMVGAGIVVGEEALTLLYTAEYAESMTAFLVLLGAGAVSFVASFAWYGITAARSFKSQVPLFIGAVLVNGVVGAVLVPGFGLVGAAVAVGCAMLWQLIGCLWILRSATRAQPSAAA